MQNMMTVHSLKMCKSKAQVKNLALELGKYTRIYNLRGSFPRKFIIYCFIIVVYHLMLIKGLYFMMF
jgi:hypothetical protein